MAYEPRQNVGSYEGLSHTIDWALEIDYDVALSNGRETLKSTLEKFNFINTSRTIEFYALPAVKAISFAFTRGDEISDISTKLMQPSVPRLIHACKDIDELELSGQEFFWGAAAESVGKPYKHFMFPCEVLNVMVMVSHCLHFGVGNDDLRAFAPYLAPPGKSKIADAVLSHFIDGRAVDDSAEYQQTFVGDALYDIYIAPMDKKSKKIQVYLKNWLSLLSKQRDGTAMNTLGHFMSVKHKTPKTFPKDAEGTYPLYRGHWAWEIACLVKLQGIDDSSFRDHEWYPRDMADYGKTV